jgi:methionyl-tRNA synthetase
MQNTIGCCLECLKCLALISTPILPQTSEKLWKMLGFIKPLTSQRWDQIVDMPFPQGQPLPPSEILFTRVEDEVIQKEIDKLKTKTQAPPAKAQIGIDDVRKLDLRVAKILTAERVPKSKKLLKLTVDIGTEHRTIAAGIGEKLTDLSSLIGKQVMIVANLKPAVLMGIESQGMILAADTELGLELPTFSQAPPGAPIA